MDVYGFDPVTFFTFFLTLMRISVLVFLLPFFGGDFAPPQVKACACLVLTLAVWQRMSLPGTAMPAHMFDIGLLILGEALMGLTLGLCVHFIFAGIQTGGEVLGFQMGFSMVALADPLTGARISATSHLLYMVSMMMFLALDGHLFLLSALADSFRIVPIGGLAYNAPLVSTVLSLSADMFILAIKIAAPIMAALFLVELALALMGRAAPQMNLLTMGFPLKIAVGFFFLSMIFTLMSTKMEDLITDLHPMFIHLMQMGK